MEICANCEEAISHDPVYEDGIPYCCPGCQSGGLCQCTYSDGALVRGGARYPERVSGGTTGPAMRDLTRGVVVVHLTGFAGPHELLAVAGAMEASDELSEVNLACLLDADAWFTVRAPSADAVADAMLRCSGPRADIVINQHLIEAQISGEPVAPFPAVPWSARPCRNEGPAGDGDSLLPARPRFRVFRPQVLAPSPQPAGQRSVLRGPMVAEDGERGADRYCILAVYPFRSFTALNQFCSAVRELDGVSSTHIQRFDHGTLYLAVRHQQDIPLRDAIAGLEQFPLSILTESDSTLEIVLRDPQSVAAGAES